MEGVDLGGEFVFWKGKEVEVEVEVEVGFCFGGVVGRVVGFCGVVWICLFERDGMRESVCVWRMDRGVKLPEWSVGRKEWKGEESKRAYYFIYIYGTAVGDVKRYEVMELV